MTIKAEQETIVRWDQAERVAWLYTAHPAQARRWQRIGYAVEVSDSDRDGQPRSWSGRVPVDAIRFRRVHNGVVVKRRGHSRGRPFGTEKRDQMGVVERHAHPGGPEGADGDDASSDATKTARKRDAMVTLVSERN